MWIISGILISRLRVRVLVSQEAPKHSLVSPFTFRVEMAEEGSSKLAATGDRQRPCHYGTFQGVANYYSPPQPVVGFPPDCVAIDVASSHWNPFCRRSDFGYVLVEGRPAREPRLPCCGLGAGWILFVSGFFFGAIPWYLGAIILLCVRVDYREKPGYIACTIASIVAALAITFGLTRGTQFGATQ